MRTTRFVAAALVSLSLLPLAAMAGTTDGATSQAAPVAPIAKVAPADKVEGAKVEQTAKVEATRHEGKEVRKSEATKTVKEVKETAHKTVEHTDAKTPASGVEATK